MYFIKYIFPIVLMSFWMTAAGQARELSPRYVYLTWQGDTGTTITVNFHTFQQPNSSVVLYDTRSRGGNPINYRFKTQGVSSQIEGLPCRFIHRVELTGLQAGQTYYFVAGDPDTGFSAERKFRTLSNDDSPVRFVTGGDMGIGEEVRVFLRRAAALEPQFALIGGDLAYVNGDIDYVHIWDQWLQNWCTEMITPNGYTIPVGASIGNHEVQGGYQGNPDKAPFYFGFFPQSGNRSYFRRQFGSNFVMYFLDSGHIAKHGGNQADWLETQLKKDQAIPYRFAIYHVPLYHSYRQFDNEWSQAGRTHWGPLFDKYGLTTAFENHDHMFKRSKLLRDGRESDKGVLYLGDGAWGKGPRTLDLTPRPYMVKAGANLHFWLVDTTAERVEYRAIDINGRVLDVYPADADGAAEADAYFATLPQKYKIPQGTIKVEPLLTDRKMFEQSEVSVIITNREQYPAKIRLAVETVAPLKAKPKERRLSLAPGQSGEFRINLTAPAGTPLDKLSAAKLNVDFNYRLPSKVATVQTSRVLAFETLRFIRRRESRIIVDGKLEEWGNLTYAMLKPRIFNPSNGEDSWHGPDDASLRFSAVYDEDFLYLALEITDDTLFVQSGLPHGNRDEISVSGDIFPGGRNDKDAWFSFSVGQKIGDSKFKLDKDAPADIVTAGVLTENGYSLEMSVPMKVFHAWRENRGGGNLEYLRLNFAISDKDDSLEKPAILYWRPRWQGEQDFPWSGVFKLE